MLFLKILFGCVGLFIFLFVAIGYWISAPKYQGPVSDHFNGKTFINTSGAQARGLGEVSKWMVERERGTWQEQKVPTAQKSLPKSSEEIKITFINHTTFLIQVAGLNIITDPVYSERVSPVQFAGPKRMKQPGIRFEDLPKIDIVLLSHNHYDHLDKATLQRLQQAHQPVVYTGLGVSAYLHQIGMQSAFDMDWWDSLSIKSGVELHCVPAQHFSGRGIFDRDATLWCGFVLKTPHGSIYFAGDTGYGSFFKSIYQRLGAPDISLLPIGAYKPEWFMSPIHTSPADAVQAHIDVQSKQSIATHFGTFPLADDGENDPVTDLGLSLVKHKISSDRFIALKEGETYSVIP